MHMKFKNSKHQVIALMACLIFYSCSNANSQSRRQTLPGEEVLAGSSMVDASFFQPFSVKGKIMEVSGDKESLFRSMEKVMNKKKVDGMEVIVQQLTYSGEKGKTGVHTTHYDPKTLQVLYWEYESFTGSTHLAFKANGTQLSGSQNPGPDAKWQSMDIGVPLFQNETRELLFRSLHKSPKGTKIKFPIIGMRPPFHGWVAYEYSKDESINYDGKVVSAKIWSAIGNPDSYYAVIDEAPYVIKRVLPAGKKASHIFSFEGVED